MYMTYLLLPAERLNTLDLFAARDLYFALFLEARFPVFHLLKSSTRTSYFTDSTWSKFKRQGESFTISTVHLFFHVDVSCNMGTFY